jgi:hypothetical protein
MEYLNSMYIDDELDLNDKISFVEKIRTDRDFADETVELLYQEKIIRSDAVYRIPIVRIEATRDWKRLPMKKIGSSGYWEIILKLPQGEHRFTYILEGRSRIADPTILTREKDDFGGENSIIHVEGKV